MTRNVESTLFKTTVVFVHLPCGSLDKTVNNVFPHYTFPTFSFTLI